MSNKGLGTRRCRPKQAVVLLSGGLDSATAAAVALSEDFNVNALSFQYGQRNRVELDAARRVASALKLSEHRLLPINLRTFGGSALTDNISVPKHRDEAAIAEGIPITYVPARNTIFLSFALAWAEVIGSVDIFIGVNALDYSGYPDCRPQYLEAFQTMARLATKAGAMGQNITIHAPLLHMTKAEIIRLGTSLGVDYALTVSCYDPDSDGLACGHCDSCLLRSKGFREAGVDDPTAYQPAVVRS